MNIKNNKNKMVALAVAGLFVLTGTYNAVVINSESHLSGSEVKFVKRLDEINGVVIPGRMVAASMNWQKLNPAQPKKIIVAENRPSVSLPVETAPSVESIPAAAVQEELSLSLVEVINPKKWEKGLTAAQFNGSLSTNNGVIEELAVSLPGGAGLSVSFSEMTGNVFEYDYDGELYSGMMYQVDQHAYMVTLTNGPLEGTRLRFSTQTPEVEQVQTQELLAENNNVDVGSFGAEPTDIQAEELIENDKQMQQEAIAAQGFNLEQGQQEEQAL